MTIGQAQDVFVVLVFGIVAAIGISKLCDLIKALFTVPLDDLPEAEPIAKSPAPVGAEDGANGKTQPYHTTDKEIKQ
jgi:hypothetical protein